MEFGETNLYLFTLRFRNLIEFIDFVLSVIELYLFAFVHYSTNYYITNVN